MAEFKNRNAEHQKKNIRLLRKELQLTQREFIDRFLAEEDHAEPISIATLSNLENKGGPRLPRVIYALSEKLGLTPAVFSLPPEEFLQLLRHKLNPTSDNDKSIPTTKKGSISQLLNQLTMYFADQLLDGTLKRGDQIESDRVLAEKMGVARSAVREALKVLEVLGMIEIHPGLGSYISDNEANFFIIPLSWSLFLNSTQIDSIVEIRNLLQIKAAELAARCQDQNCLSRFHRIFEHSHMDYLNQDYAAFLQDDLEFHLCIAECSGNPVIYSLMQSINNLMRRVSQTGMINPEQLKDVYEEHQKIYGFILTQDPLRAREAMEDHVHHSVERYNYSS